MKYLIHNHGREVLWMENLLKRVSTLKYAERLKKTMDIVVCHDKNANTCSDFMDKILCMFQTVKKEHHTIFFIGNGGSAGIAVHMTADFLKNGGIKTHSMFDVSTITCLANDFGYEHIFGKQLKIVAEKDDIVVAISSSGNSINILNAINVARNKECKIITFSGFTAENKLRKLGDFNIYVPSMEYGLVESIHNMILQQIVDEIVMKDGIGLE